LAWCIAKFRLFLKGYAAVTTDGGHPIDDMSNMTWATTDEGSVNWYAFLDYAGVALDDAATLGKAAALAYYGREPDYSYWNVRKLWCTLLMSLVV
jgi:hypothetical protein